MIAALVYHYEPDAGGGTAITDVFINDGDFYASPPARRRVRRPPDRRPPARGRRRPQPAAPLSDPDDGLRGLERGRRPDRAADAGRQPVRRLRGRRPRAAPPLSRPGPARGRRPPRGARLDPRFRPLARGPRLPAVGRPLPRRGAAAIVRGRSARAVVAAGRAADEAGRPRAARPPGSRVRRSGLGARAAGLRRSAVARDRARPRRQARRRAHQRSRARGSDRACSRRRRPPADARDDVADAFFARWPYRSLDHLLAEVPGGARAAPAQEPHRLRPRGRDEEQGTLASLGPPPADGGAARPLANPELFGALLARRGRCTRRPCGRSRRSRRTWTRPCTIRRGVTTPDDVSIGRGRPLHHQPGVAVPALRRNGSRRGRFVAGATWSRTASWPRPTRSRSSSSAPATAGSRATSLDAVARSADDERRWRVFAARRAVPHLRNVGVAARQAARAARRATPSSREGDARRPAETLSRDFPDGLRGFVRHQRGPRRVRRPQGGADARGRGACAALVVPRVEPPCAMPLGAALSQPDRRGGRRAVRRTFGLRENPGDFYLDGGHLGAR